MEGAFGPGTFTLSRREIRNVLGDLHAVSSLAALRAFIASREAGLVAADPAAGPVI